MSDVSFRVGQGEFVFVVGKSGAGKTTLLKLITREEPLSSGQVLFQNINVSLLYSKALQEMRRHLGVVHQDYKLLEDKTVEENLGYVMQAVGAANRAIKRDAPQVLDLVGLLEKQRCFPCELSGGEKQRLAIARALVHRPQIIIADEPTGNLDLYNTYAIINLFKKINSLGTAVMLFTHDKEVVNRLRKRVITLDSGKIVRDDPKGKFLL